MIQTQIQTRYRVHQKVALSMSRLPYIAKPKNCSMITIHFRQIKDGRSNHLKNCGKKGSALLLICLAKSIVTGLKSRKIVLLQRNGSFDLHKLAMTILSMRLENCCSKKNLQKQYRGYRKLLNWVISTRSISWESYISQESKWKRMLPRLCGT